MRVLHLMLSNFYIDNANYQENILPRIHKRDGHEVEIIASTDVFVENNVLGSTTPSQYFNEDGIKVTRLPYRNMYNRFLEMKIRAYPHYLYKKIEDFNPDIILFHGTAAYALNTVAKYKKNNPGVKLFVDSHEDFNNSANRFLSKEILHNLFYKKIVHRNLKYIDKVLYITYETYQFLSEFYKIPEEKLVFFPLGGLIPSKERVSSVRERLRSQLGMAPDDILCIHSGKMDKLKRTEEILEAFNQTKGNNFKLIIIGSVEKSLEPILDSYLKKDGRIVFLGWKSPNELQDYLIASDLYIQLGSQSATMQQAVCNGCVVAVFPFESHKFLLKDACYYISNTADIVNVLKQAASNKTSLAQKRLASKKISDDVLDYNVISNMIFNI